MSPRRGWSDRADVAIFALFLIVALGAALLGVLALLLLPIVLVARAVRS